MNKLIFMTLIGVVMFGGCSNFFSGEPSQDELKLQYNMLLETFVDTLRVDKVDHLTCNHTGYAFPSEQEGPIYECQALVHFMNGKSIQDQLSFYRRPKGLNGDIDIRNSNVIEGLRQIEDEKQSAIEEKRLEDMALEGRESENQRILTEENESTRQKMSENSETQHEFSNQVVEGGE